MSTTTLLLQPPTNSTPSHTHTLSQQAPSYLKSQSPGLTLPWPLSLLTTSESQEKWQIHENLALASLRANDLTTAEKALKALDSRFGLENERVAALRGLHAEATAKNESELQQVMEHYEEILKEDPACFAIRKRRIALLRSQGKISEAVGALVNFLDSNPTDAEAWSEMAEMYVQTGAWEQAIFALEEVLLLVPNAWNVHARMGEVVYMSGAAGRGGEELVKSLAESMRRFCRSVELCDGYLRGYFGLKVVCIVYPPPPQQYCREKSSADLYGRRRIDY